MFLFHQPFSEDEMVTLKSGINQYSIHIRYMISHWIKSHEIQWLSHEPPHELHWKPNKNPSTTGQVLVDGPGSLPTHPPATWLGTMREDSLALRRGTGHDWWWLMAIQVSWGWFIGFNITWCMKNVGVPIWVSGKLLWETLNVGD